MKQSQVPAADATLRLLSYLAAQGRPVRASTMITALDLPRSSVYQLLAVLKQRGFVVHLPEDRKYGLGVAAFELSSGYSRQVPITRLGRPLLAQLVDRLGESAHLAVLHGRDVVYVVEERARRRPHLITDVGVRLPSHLTASGRALLAGLPRGQVRALYSDPSVFVKRTDGGIRSYVELRRTLDSVVDRGFAVEDGEVTEGLASVAVAFLDHVGWPAAAIAVTFPREQIPENEWPALARDISGTSAELSKRIRGG